MGLLIKIDSKWADCAAGVAQTSNLTMRSFGIFVGLICLTLLPVAPQNLSARIAGHGFTSVGGVHSFSGDPSPEYHYGDSSRSFVGGGRFLWKSEDESALRYAIDLSAVLNLGSTGLDHPARPANRRTLTESSDVPLSSRKNHRGLELLDGSAFYVGLGQEAPHLLDFFGGSTGDPFLELFLGRRPTRSQLQDWLLGRPGYFPGIHFLFDTDGYGRLVFSPAYILDSARQDDGVYKKNDLPWLKAASRTDPARSLSRRKDDLRSSYSDASRYGVSAFYYFGRTIQLGFGFRQQIARRNARLYLPGDIEYLQAFLGYEGDHAEFGLGYSHATGSLGQYRRTEEEKRKTDNEYQEFPHPGNGQNRRKLEVNAAELHGYVRLHWKSFETEFAFFFPQADSMADQTPGYIQPGLNMLYLPLTADYLKADPAPHLCRNEDGKECFGLSGSYHARYFLRMGYFWNGYQAEASALYSRALSASGQAPASTGSDPSRPDYVEAQIRISRQWNLMTRAFVSLSYGRIWIRKTRPSKAFAEYMAFSMEVKLEFGSAGGDEEP